MKNLRSRQQGVVLPARSYPAPPPASSALKTPSQEEASLPLRGGRSVKEQRAFPKSTNIYTLWFFKASLPR